MKRPTTILAWTLCLVCVVAGSAQMIWWLRGLASAPNGAELLQQFGWTWAVPVVFSVMAAVIITRQPGNRVGWLLLLPALTTALSPDTFLAAPRTALTPALWLLLWFDFWSWIPVIFPILLIPLHFPTGRPPSPRWRWVNWLAIAFWMMFMLFVASLDTIGPLNYDWRLDNPIGFIPTGSEGLFGTLMPFALLAITLGSVTSLIVRYRRAGLVEKEQIKWLLYASALFGVLYIGTTIANGIQDEWSSGIWVDLLRVFSALLLPVAIAIAILRYRLFDIDIIIRKTAVYGALTVLLALVYFGSVIVMQTLFGSVIGAQSPLILVVSTLLIALLFSPLRSRVQGIIDRRFFRRKYDAQQVLARFAQSARDETNLDYLTAELLTVLQETLQPQSVSLWTAAPTRNRQTRER